jgi:hypothetical protein
MAEVTSGSDLTVIILDENEVEQLSIVLNAFAEDNAFPAHLFELADALGIELPEQSED